MTGHLADQPFPLVRFCRQYLQLEQDLTYPDDVLLRTESAQTFLYTTLFAPNALSHPLPPRYQLRTLKNLVSRIENAIDDWEEYVSEKFYPIPSPTPSAFPPDDLMGVISRLMLAPSTSDGAATLDEKSYVTYHQSLLGLRSSRSAPSIALLEHRSLISAAGTTGLRTWEASLHLGQYLCSDPSLVRDKHVLELGAGTGYLSILCAKYLGARHVVASDGSDRVVNNLSDNFDVNGLQGSDRIVSTLLEWGHEPLPIGPDGGQLGGGAGGGGNAAGVVDLVLGADITFDKTLALPLVATLKRLATSFPRAEILLSATQRNKDTFDHFLSVCHQAGLHVLVADYPIQPAGEQMGPFYDSSTPIRVCRVTGGRRNTSSHEE